MRCINTGSAKVAVAVTSSAPITLLLALLAPLLLCQAQSQADPNTLPSRQHNVCGLLRRLIYRGWQNGLELITDII